MTNERLLGELLANQKNLHEDVVEIKNDVKALNEFRGLWLGKLSAYVGILATVTTVVIEWFIFKR